MRDITVQVRQLETNLIEHCENFVYNYKRGYVARFNTGVKPLLVPVFWNAVFDGVIITDDEAVGKILRGKWEVSGMEDIAHKHTPVNILYGRCHNVYASLLRELDVCCKLLMLDPDGRVFKDIDKDVGEGRIDIIFRKSNGKILNLAIAHEGAGSLEHENRRKRQKEGNDVIKLTARCYKDNDIHLVPLKMIKAIL